LANGGRDDGHSDDVERGKTRGNGERRRDVPLVIVVKGPRRRRDFKGTIERRYRAGSRFSEPRNAGGTENVRRI